MKKTNFLTLIISIFILLPTVHADCTTEEINHFKEIEDKYKVTYEFNEDTKDYTVTFHDADSNTFQQTILDSNDETKEVLSTCKLINDNDIECYNISPGTYIIEVIGVSDTCDDTLKTTTLKLGSYNNYSEDALCNGIEEFVLCQPTYDKEITYEEFVSRVETYKKAKEKESNNDTINQDNNENKIVEYIENNMFQVIVIGVFIIMLVITVILTARSIRKSRRLE